MKSILNYSIFNMRLCCCNRHVKIVQNKNLRTILNTLYYISNKHIHRGLKIDTIITRPKQKHSINLNQ